MGNRDFDRRAKVSGAIGMVRFKLTENADGVAACLHPGATDQVSL